MKLRRGCHSNVPVSVRVVTRAEGVLALGTQVHGKARVRFQPRRLKFVDKVLIGWWVVVAS